MPAGAVLTYLAGYEGGGWTAGPRPEHPFTLCHSFDAK